MFIEVTFIFILTLASLYYCFHNKNGLPTNWPIVGMLPAVLKNTHRINDYITELVEKSQLCFHLKGPWFTNMHLLVTADPANVQYVMSKNFKNYPKGTKNNEIFDAFGDGALVNSDDPIIWQYHHKIVHSFFGNPNFQKRLVKKIEEKVESGLIPILDYVCDQGNEIDLQDLFVKFTFDTICTILISHDPKSLSIDLPRVPQAQALDDMEHTIAYRYALPSCVWKFLRWLNVGLERKHREACEILDEFIYKFIAFKRKEMSKDSSLALENNPEVAIVLDSSELQEWGRGVTSLEVLTLYMSKNDQRNDTFSNDKFLRDTVLAYFLAGRDTVSTALSWFFYLLSKNQSVVSKIRQELNETMVIDPKDSREYYSKLVYLHAALCESLRLYPSVPFEAKSPVETDILPSGHKVEPHMQILFSLYAMGRMKSIWGDDCCEFKPERWICEQGKFRNEPSYKFLAFNAGPRACLGKDMAFMQMKAVTATIIRNYDIKAVEGHMIVPDFSFILHMKHGFKVKVVRKY